jgi:hypothetical protein
MISIYRPGTSSLHRLSAGPKILFFAILTLIMGLSLTSLPCSRSRSSSSSDSMSWPALG